MRNDSVTLEDASPDRVRMVRAVRAARFNITCDRVSEFLLYAMLVFSPWAFGTTQKWSVNLMNLGGYLLGLLCAAKWIARGSARWRPAVWGERKTHWTTWASFLLTALLLLYCLVGALNRRADFNLADRSFTYYEAIDWLPHSYDGKASWEALAGFVALACSFWAVRDWLLTRSPSELEARGRAASERTPRLPNRLRRLLWVLSVNGALLALECFLQRMSGTNRLLWIIEPWINKSAEAQLGPYAYRSNAVQYLLLLWPVSLAWWGARPRKMAAERASTHNNLLPCVLMMAIVPLFSLSRAGAIIGSAAIVGAIAVLVRRRGAPGTKALLAGGGVLAVGLALGILMDWHRLNLRFTEASIDSNRTEIWLNTWTIIQDFPLFGTGPGTFGSVYHLYRPTVDDVWHAYAHNDWMEFLMTLGGAGFACGLVLLGLVMLSPLVEQRIVVPRTFYRLLYLSLSTCLVFAVVDFPFQVYSVAFLFVILCGILASISPRPGR